MSSLPAVARVGVAAGWHASPSTSAPAVGHLMPTSWAADDRKTRPALCGERRMRWLAAAAVDRELQPCDRCLAVAEQKPPIGKQVQIAPSAPRAAAIVGRRSDPPQPNTALDRLARRCAFRDELAPMSDRALAYPADELHRLMTRHLVRPAPSPGRPLIDVDDPDDAYSADVDVDEDQALDEPAGQHDPHRPLAYSTST